MVGKSDGDKKTLLNKALLTLRDLVLPHAAALVRASMIKTAAALNMVGERIDQNAEAIRQGLLARGEPPEAVEQMVAEAREKMTEIGRGFGQRFDEMVEQAVAESTALVVATWANALGLFASRSGGIAWLRLSQLGDDMLPVGAKDCDEAFDADFVESPIDGLVARDILRAFRASLPVGKVLPDEMVTALDLTWDIVVVP